MNQKIKLLLLAFGLGLFLNAARSDESDPCDPCNGPNPPAYCCEDEDNDDCDSMPEGMIVDDMPTARFADEVALSTTPSGAASSAVK